jgi:hypothetical protein
MDELLITIMKHVSFAQQEAITIIRQLPRTLCHQGIIGMGSDPCYVDAPLRRWASAARRRRSVSVSRSRLLPS